MDQQQAFQAYANGFGFVQDEWTFSAGLTYQQNYNCLPMKPEYGDHGVQSALQWNTLPQFDYASQTLGLPVGEHQNYCEEQMPNFVEKGIQDAEKEQESPQQEGPTSSEMEAFTKTLKSKRLSLGYTQADVGYALGVLYGKWLSQTTICRFESLELSFRNMCKLKPILTDWLNDLDNTDNLEELIKRRQAQPQRPKRKHRTNIETNVKQKLENYFMNCTKPGAQEITQIARELGMDKSVVRVWFCNRRQKGKRQLYPYLRENIGEHPDVVKSLSPPIEQHLSLPQLSTDQAFAAAEIQYNHPVYMPGFHTNMVYPQNIPHGMPMAHYAN
ncbi:POU domain, class 5, transcription factor 1.2-like [Dendrobates tinctorius]|uniref:POU domain, class 5, transcription factor 1.2-like n=1 Tax=Dendrobates tinctorius TaxID=92724 RepID=UPI003CCA56C4